MMLSRITPVAGGRRTGEDKPGGSGRGQVRDSRGPSQWGWKAKVDGPPGGWLAQELSVSVKRGRGRLPGLCPE